MHQSDSESYALAWVRERATNASAFGIEYFWTFEPERTANAVLRVGAAGAGVRVAYQALVANLDQKIATASVPDPATRPCRAAHEKEAYPYAREKSRERPRRSFSHPGIRRLLNRTTWSSSTHNKWVVDRNSYFVNDKGKRSMDKTNIAADQKERYDDYEKKRKIACGNGK